MTALILSALTAAGSAQASIGDPALRIAMCGGGSASFPPDRLPHAPKHDCPAGCHALCDRKRPGQIKQATI
jgi:hypothetical protein